MAKILLVEDDALLSKLYQKKLTVDGFDVVVCHDGQEGFEKMKAWQPDLVLMDMMMPKLNGIQTLEKAKADMQTKHIPIIMLTNMSGVGDAELALSKGAASYLVKSDQKPAEVIEQVRMFLKQKKNN